CSPKITITEKGEGTKESDNKECVTEHAPIRAAQEAIFDVHREHLLNKFSDLMQRRDSSGSVPVMQSLLSTYDRNKHWAIYSVVMNTSNIEGKIYLIDTRSVRYRHLLQFADSMFEASNPIAASTVFHVTNRYLYPPFPVPSPGMRVLSTVN